jgi:hypothetical protein
VPGRGAGLEAVVEALREIVTHLEKVENLNQVKDPEM